jgi:hypothetical protein
MLNIFHFTLYTPVSDTLTHKVSESIKCGTNFHKFVFHEMVKRVYFFRLKINYAIIYLV